jgi:Protein of unknown function (DUF1761)
MGDVEINVWGLLAALVVSMVVGMVWYSKLLFHDRWVKAAKIDEKRLGKDMPKAMVVMVITSLVLAYVLAHVTYLSYVFFHYSYLQSAITTSFWMWLGFVATIVLRLGAFEQRDMKLTALTLGNTLVSFLAMGAAIGFVGL